MDDHGDIIIYQTEDGLTKIDVSMQDEIHYAVSGDQPTLREAKIAKNYLDEKELQAMGQLVSELLKITTGNELVKQQIADFSKQLDLNELYSYIFEVQESTEKIVGRLSYDELKRNISEERKEYLRSLNVVSTNENAMWLIDYWCNKDVRGLIQMPFSRHWIMHIQACSRIENKIHLTPCLNNI